MFVRKSSQLFSFTNWYLFLFLDFIFKITFPMFQMQVYFFLLPWFNFINCNYFPEGGCVCLYTVNVIEQKS